MASDGMSTPTRGLSDEELATLATLLARLGVAPITIPMPLVEGLSRPMGSAEVVATVLPVACDEIATIATDAWRLRHWLADLEPADPGSVAGRLRRGMDHLWESMSRAGIQIYDHTGATYDPGMSLYVLAFQPTADVSDEVIGETVKPTVYCHDVLVQVGEVVVLRPELPPSVNA